MQTDLYLIRHGETATNRAHLIQGWDSEPLNLLGRWQAERTAARLAKLDIQALYASPFCRAHQTAQFIGGTIGREVVLVAKLREMDTGNVSGLHSAQFIVRYPRLAWAWLRDDAHLAFPGGEALTQFYTRAWQVVDELVARHRGQAIIVVAHGGIIAGYLSLLLNGRSSNRIAWSLRNGSICHIRWQDDASAQLLAFNDTAHLHAPSSPVTNGSGT